MDFYGFAGITRPTGVAAAERSVDFQALLLDCHKALQPPVVPRRISPVRQMVVQFNAGQLTLFLPLRV
jgi:hypothetical protein